MSEARLHRWTVEEFLAWEERQGSKYELVDGQPRLMTGGTQGHAVIAANILRAVGPRLDGSGCRATGADVRVVTGTDNVRYPDVTIDGGAFRPNSHNASDPVLVVEVLSRTTAWTDLHHKLHDYESTPSIRQYLIVAQDESRVELWAREASGRLALAISLTGTEGTIVLEPDSIPLAMAEIYRSFDFAQPDIAP